MSLHFDMTEEDYQSHEDNNDGLCIDCGSFRDGFTEPDARNYLCEDGDCGKKKVFGMQELLLMGRIQFI